jgi:hypothetical protein
MLMLVLVLLLLLLLLLFAYHHPTPSPLTTTSITITTTTISSSTTTPRAGTSRRQMAGSRCHLDAALAAGETTLPARLSVDYGLHGGESAEGAGDQREKRERE